MTQSELYTELMAATNDMRFCIEQYGYGDERTTAAIAKAQGLGLQVGGPYKLDWGGLLFKLTVYAFAFYGLYKFVRLFI